MGGRRARPRSSLSCELERDIHAIAIDLPGVGASRGVTTANDKRTLARCIRGAVEGLGLRQVVLAGHDIGGMIAYAYVAAYARPDALRTGFEWYRAFEQDAKDNIESKGIAVPIPTLCVRGSREPGRLEDYVRGLRDAGLSRARGERIDDCGHFSPDEQPAALAAALRRFTIESSRAD
jgi:pimeloyl-ACP methyl ester carboxylesterase